MIFWCAKYLPQIKVGTNLSINAKLENIITVQF